MSGNELLQWVLSDFWRIVGALILIGVTASGFETLINSIRSTPEERMQKRLLKHEAQMQKARFEHEQERPHR